MRFLSRLFKPKRKTPPFNIYDKILTNDPDRYGNLSFSHLTPEQVQLIKKLNTCIEDFFHRQIIYILQYEKSSEQLQKEPFYAIACFFEVSLLSYMQITWILSRYKREQKIGKALYDCLFYTFRHKKIFQHEYANETLAFSDRLDIYQSILMSLMDPKSDAMTLGDKLYATMIKSPGQPYRETINWNFTQSQAKKSVYWQYLAGSMKMLNDEV